VTASRNGCLAIAAACVAVCMSASASSADAADYVVDTPADRQSLPCLPLVGGCSLREALISTASSSEADTISFRLLLGSTISPMTPLPLQPDSAGAITIDGTGSGACVPGAPGVSIDGSAAPAGAPAGLDLAGAGSRVCGLAIYDWPKAGLRLAGAGSTVISSFIGTGIGGTETGLGNGTVGVLIEGPGSVVGRADAGNVIVGNAESGVKVTKDAGEGTVIAANSVGTGRDGAPNPNGDGIHLFGDGTIVGGTTEGSGNLVAGNKYDGIRIDEEAQRNPLLGNSIYDNRDSNVNLEPGAFTFFRNDHLDLDEGGNRLQNMPGFQSSLTGTNAAYTRVFPELESAPNQTFRIEYFTNSEKRCTLDPSDGQSIFTGPAAEHFLGAVEVTTDADGYTDYRPYGDPPMKLPPSTPGDYLSGTATDSEGNTSRIGGCSKIGEIGLPQLDESVVAVSNSGTGLVEVVCVDINFDCNADLRINVPGGPAGRPEGLLENITVPNDGRPHVQRIQLGRHVANRLRHRRHLRGKLAISSVQTFDGEPNRVKLVSKKGRH
jgi:hypothetical protein